MPETSEQFADRVSEAVKKEGLHDLLIQALACASERRFLDAIHVYDTMLSKNPSKETTKSLQQLRAELARNLNINDRIHLMGFITIHNDTRSSPKLINPVQYYPNASQGIPVKVFRNTTSKFPHLHEGEIRAMIVRAFPDFCDNSQYYYEWLTAQSPDNICLIIALYDLDRQENVFIQRKSENVFTQKTPEQKRWWEFWK